ncbi:MAG: sodium:proton exchanger [Actinobacteria bacterium]|nr:sodium:proton exchanger [Actinomycetota bacterium]
MLAGVLALTIVAGILHYAGVNAVVIFVVSAAALAGLAWVIAIATETVGDRFGPAVTGVLQSTLGNLPELFVVMFALSAGELVVAKTSIIGSLLANALLVLGLSIVAGARAAPDGMMSFKQRLPNDTATLLLMAVFVIALLGVSDRVGDRASNHQVAISVIGAVCLLAVYGAWVWSYLRSDVAPTEQPSAHRHVSFRTSIILLAAGGAAAAFVSDWFVAALDPAVKSIGISKAFTGLVIVGIAGNAVENVVGIWLAAKGQSDLAMAVIKNSVSQIAVFLFPLLVLISLLFATHLTFVLNPIYVIALVLMAIAVWQITGDGKAVMFEGLALVALYVVVATLAFYE